MDLTVIPGAVFIALVGVVAGLWLLARGFGGYRTATRLGDTATSAIGSLAAGEVRVSGVIEPAEVRLVSPLQSEPCVYYRASVGDAGEISGLDTDFEEERAVGFRVADATGSVRIFPRGARFDAPLCLDEQTGSFGETPTAVSLRVGGTTVEGQPDRAAQIEALLSVRPATRAVDPRLGERRSESGQRYRESRLAPGDVVTVVGRAIPFSDLADPTEADVAVLGGVPADDPEVAADLAAALASGTLAADAEAAWGNAAIPGFGIGRPVSRPVLDPAADPLPLAPAQAATQAARTFAISPETLVLASTIDGPLLIAHGMPEIAMDRHQDRFVLGLLGAVLAIGSAMALAVMISGGLGS
jgi:hypothetical protein